MEHISQSLPFGFFFISKTRCKGWKQQTGISASLLKRLISLPALLFSQSVADAEVRIFYYQQARQRTPIFLTFN
jgi:hypothetical protein